MTLFIQKSVVSLAVLLAATEVAAASPERALYEQAQSNTLVFTTSTSNHLQQTNGKTTAFTGVYQCTLEDDLSFKHGDDFYASSGPPSTCQTASKLGTGRSFAGALHTELILRNLQFDLSSLRSDQDLWKAPVEAATLEPGEDEDAVVIDTPTAIPNRPEPKNYLYGNTHLKYGHGNEIIDWEIVRAELPRAGDMDSPVLEDDGSLKFESVFRTLQASNDWNDCDFQCCVRVNTNKEDYDTSDADEYRHAYAQTVARSFAIDEHTGDLFLSWEGFYKDCTKLFDVNKMEWVLGISRVRTEDPACTPTGSSDETYQENIHWARCTEPVSIFHSSTTAREDVLPYGGFAVVPAASTGSNKRLFLVSVLKLGGQLRLRAVPELLDASHDGNNGRWDVAWTTVDTIFWDQNVWDGGTIRVGYNASTGKPEHLCRSVYDRGIECLSVAIDNQHPEFPMLTARGDPEIFFSAEQTAVFCRLADADFTKRENWGRRTTLVTGLDVRWDPVTGAPERIFFGCFGGEGGNGNFGSVEKDGRNLHTVLDGAYAEAVLFLPKELEGTIHPRSVPTTPEMALTQSRNHYISDVTSALAFFLLAGLAWFYYHRQRNFQKGARFLSPSRLQRETGFRTPYVELQNVASPQGMLPVPSSLSSPASPEDEEQVRIIL